MKSGTHASHQAPRTRRIIEPPTGSLGCCVVLFMAVDVLVVVGSDFHVFVHYIFSL
jgi:hypothetical protein